MGTDQPQTSQASGASRAAPAWDDFAAWMQAQKYSPITIYNYSFFFRELAGVQLTQEWIEAFVRRHNHAAARAFLNKYIEWQKLERTFIVPKVKGRQGQPRTEYLTTEEVEKLIKELPDVRYSILVKASFETGCRISEVLNWTPLNVDFKTLQVRGIGKGNKPYEVIISEETAELLTILSENLMSEKEPFFSFGRKRAWAYLAQHGQRILGKHVHPHMMRHSMATALIKKGMSLQEVKEYGRWSDFNTMLRYEHSLQQETVQQNARAILTKSTTPTPPAPSKEAPAPGS